MKTHSDCTIDTKGLDIDCALPKPELREVERHQIRLIQRLGRDVSKEEALEDWLRNHAAQWRAARQREALACQCEEMLRHKWIESEKAKRDLGNEAIFDWIHRHAAQWRAWYEHHCDQELRPKDMS